MILFGQDQGKRVDRFDISTVLNNNSLENSCSNKRCFLRVKYSRRRLVNGHAFATSCRKFYRTNFTVFEIFWSAIIERKCENLKKSKISSMLALFKDLEINIRNKFAVANGFRRNEITDRNFYLYLKLLPVLIEKDQRIFF